MSDAEPSTRTAATDETYRQIRVEMQFEFSLINARVNWLIASQAFLFTPLVMGVRGTSLAQSMLFPHIPILGLTLCLLVLLAILAAVWRSWQWRAKCERAAYRGIGEKGRFSIVAPRTPLIPLMGLIGTVGVPLVIAGVWLWILILPPSLPG